MAFQQLFYDFVNMFMVSLVAVSLALIAEYHIKKYLKRKPNFANRGSSTQPVRYNNYIEPPRASRPRARPWTPPAATARPIQPFLPARNDYLLSVQELQEGRRCAPPAYSE